MLQDKRILYSTCKSSFDTPENETSEAWSMVSTYFNVLFLRTQSPVDGLPGGRPHAQPGVVPIGRERREADGRTALGRGGHRGPRFVRTLG